MAKCWSKTHQEVGVSVGENEGEDEEEDGFTYFANAMDEKYFDAAANAMEQKLGPLGPVERHRNAERFQKLFSQALAASSVGTVYVMLPWWVDPTDAWFLVDNTWRQWEYPALTRNSRVTSIMRVDPRDDDQRRDEKGVVQDGGPIEIWRKGNPPSPKEPRGTNWPTELISSR